MRSWIAIVAVAALMPTAADGRALHGRYQGQPVEGVAEWYRFHRDLTYEWMQELEGPQGTLHRWHCGRYLLEGRTLILREDPSEKSCKRRGPAPAHFTERWVLAEKLRKKAVVLGGAAFTRAAQDAPPTTLAAVAAAH